MITAEQVSSAYSAIDQYFQTIREFEEFVDQVRYSESSFEEQIVGTVDTGFDQRTAAMQDAGDIADNRMQPLLPILVSLTPPEKRFQSGIWRDERLYTSVFEAIDAWLFRMQRWGNRVLDRKRKHPYRWSSDVFTSPLSDNIVGALQNRRFEEEFLLLQAVSKYGQTGSQAKRETTKNDTKNDTPKKSRKKYRRPMNDAAIACVRRFKYENPLNLPMKTVVDEYAEETRNSASGIMRTLNDNPDQWKNDID